MSTTTSPVRQSELVPTRRIAPWVALTAAAAVSALAWHDALFHAITGKYFESESTAITVAGGLVHAFAYLLLAAVVHLNRHSIDAGHRVVRSVRLPLSVVMLVNGVGMLATTVAPATEDVFGVLGSVSFLGAFLLAMTLGITMLATRRRTPAAWLLAGILPTIALTVLLAALAPLWVHPAYAETALHFGLALLVLPQSRPVGRA